MDAADAQFLRGGSPAAAARADATTSGAVAEAGAEDDAHTGDTAPVDCTALDEAACSKHAACHPIHATPLVIEPLLCRAADAPVYLACAPADCERRTGWFLPAWAKTRESVYVSNECVPYDYYFAGSEFFRRFEVFVVDESGTCVRRAEAIACEAYPPSWPFPPYGTACSVDKNKRCVFYDDKFTYFEFGVRFNKDTDDPEVCAACRAKLGTVDIATKECER